MAGIHNYTWGQGEDLVVSIIYKTVDEAGVETYPDLTNYSVRMDIATPDGQRVYTFNSAEIADVDATDADVTPDSTLEVSLGTAGEINITVPRSVTLPGGEAYTFLTANPPVLIYDYDIFLRDNATVPKQKKILQGQISIEKSVTLWQ